MKAQEITIERDLSEVLKIFQEAIPNGDAYEFELTPLDRLQIPLWGAFVWAKNGDFSDGFGYGADSLSARVSAWGEILENYFATATLAEMPRVASSYVELIERGERAVDPLKLCLNAGADYAPNKQIVWTRGFSYPKKEFVWLPLEAVAIAPNDISGEISPEEFLMMPITNGLGAGANLEQALAHGILEQVQRDGDSVTFRAMDEGVKIELDAVENEETRRLLAFLDEENIEIFAKFAGISCGMTVIYVVGYDRNIDDAPFQLSLSACGEAAHPDREVALSKALREYVSSRARKRFMHGSIADMKRVAPEKYCLRVTSDEVPSDESRALRSILSWLKMSRREFYEMIKSPIYDVRSSVKFSELPTVSIDQINSPERIMNLLDERMKAENLEIFYADFAPENADYAVVKAVVAGLEVETMSYNRIGRRNLERLLERGRREPKFADLVGIGDANKPKDALKIHLTNEDEKEVGGEAWLSPSGIERAVGDLYGLYREPNGHLAGKIMENEK